MVTFYATCCLLRKQYDAGLLYLVPSLGLPCKRIAKTNQFFDRRIRCEEAHHAPQAVSGGDGASRALGGTGSGHCTGLSEWRARSPADRFVADAAGVPRSFESLPRQTLALQG
jgi:hypothetical protein